LLSSLNNSQREAVEYIDGPSLVIAGAGSGKTRVITYKIAYLIKMGLPAYNILALTFTNKAANEMKERIAQLVDYRAARGLWIGTFHSVFAKILRAEAERLGYSNKYSIYDADDSKKMISNIVKELKLDDKKYKATGVACRISSAKNALITPNLYARNYEMLREDKFHGQGEIYQIYQIYNKRLKAADAMDFDDLLLNMCILLRDNRDLLEKYQDLFKYILVDEYQDTNTVQSYIVKQLANKHKRLCVVGDDAQSIYSFRGANIQNILGFQDDFKDCHIFRLEQNYRSTQNIVDAANSLIKKNTAQLFKNVFSENEKGSLIKVLSSYSDRDEAQSVSDEIRRLHRLHQYQEMVILYRTHSQSRVFEEALMDQNIPYKIYGGLSFYQRREVKDVLAYLRLIVNEKDDESFKRIVNVPSRKIGDTTIAKLVVYANQNEKSLFEVAKNIVNYDVDLNIPTKQKIFDFAQQIQHFQQKKEELNAYELADYVINKTGFLEALKIEKDAENLARVENVEELKSAIMEFCKNKMEGTDDADMSIESFLSEVSLLSDMDKSESETDANHVTLMTIHASKCLEYRDVFIVGVEENLLPACDAFDELEEERRLMYVAITRAKENCIISYAKQRFRNGQMAFNQPSRFISDIDEKFLDLPLEYKWSKNKKNDSIFDSSFRSHEYDEKSYCNEDEKEPYKPFKATEKPKKMMRIENVSSKPSTGNFSNSSNQLQVGMKINHERFGTGTIVEIEGEGDSCKIRVDFGSNQMRQLLLKFAKFTVVK